MRERQCFRRAASCTPDNPPLPVVSTEEANDRLFAEMLARRGNQIFSQSSCGHANSYYFDKNGDVPLRPTTTLESAIRSRRFKFDDCVFGAVDHAGSSSEIRRGAAK